MALEDGGSMAVSLKDGGGMAALGGGVGKLLRIAAVALGNGGGRRTCDYGISISIVKAKGLLLQCQCQRRQGQQERTRLMQGTYVGSNCKEIDVLWQWWWWQRW